MRTLRLVLPAVLLAAGVARSADPSIDQVIDKHIDAKLTADAVTPAPQADDATLIRRLTLDLVGRIPTLGEVEEFVKSSDPGKRAKLVDRLMGSPGYVRHQAAQFEVMLADTSGSGRRSSGSLRDYLTTAMKENRPWDRVFRELMLPDDANKGSTDFLLPRLRDADRLTNDVSVSFFGVNVSCAQCHDHPLVKDWTQDHFYGMKAFLVRTVENAGFIAERGSGVVRYKPTKGPEKAAKMMFLSGAAVTDPADREPTKDDEKKEKVAFDKAKAEKKPTPAPKFSARAKLVEVALKPGNADFFARSIVNRVWHRFFGLGLVTPLDQMHSENPPSHPELLTLLARDVQSHGYDLRRIVRGIVLSQAYSRSSRYPSAAAPDPRLFAVARLKPLTPMQLAAAMKIARTDPATLDGKKPEEFEKAVEQLESSARGFAGMIAQPTDNFQIGVGEALLFSNGDRVQKEFLADSNDSTLARVKGVTDAKEAVGLLAKVALCRPATADELAAMAEYVEKRSDRRPEALRQVLWALMTCPEFRFNH